MPVNRDIEAPAVHRRNYMKGQPDIDNTIAYCHNFIHMGAMSKNMVKKHQCIQKNCKYFVKNLDNEYWARKQALSEANKREKLLKWYEDKSGTGAKKTNGRLLRVNSSSINTDLESMLQFFKDIEVYHIYIFYQDKSMKMKYIGGFYGKDVATEKAKEYVREEMAEYVLICDECGSTVGFRVLDRNRNLVEIDLSWGYLYKALRQVAEENVARRISDKEEAIS